MLKANFITAEEAAGYLKDGMTLCPVAMTLVSACESILKEIEKSYQ